MTALPLDKVAPASPGRNNVVALGLSRSAVDATHTCFFGDYARQDDRVRTPVASHCMPCCLSDRTILGGRIGVDVDAATCCDITQRREHVSSRVAHGTSSAKSTVTTRRTRTCVVVSSNHRSTFVTQASRMCASWVRAEPHVHVNTARGDTRAQRTTISTLTLWHSASKLRNAKYCTTVRLCASSFSYPVGSCMLRNLSSWLNETSCSRVIRSSSRVGALSCDSARFAPSLRISVHQSQQHTRRRVTHRAPSPKTTRTE